MAISEMLGRSARMRRRLEESWHRLYRLAYSWCHDPQLSADLVQDALARALKSHHQLRDEQAFDSWLFTILANCWRNHCRKPEALNIDDFTISHQQSPELDHDRSQLLHRIRVAMTQLNHDQRQVLTLVALEGLAYDEVARVLGISIGTVMSRLCRARKRLRQLLGEGRMPVGGSSPGLWRVK
jgi:RNA polymerase sigma-70 factor (ECF subfamily)